MRYEKIDWSVEENNEDEKLLIADRVVLKEKLTEAAEELDFIISQRSDLEMNNIELAYKTICNQCQDVVEFIKPKKFSSIYPYLSEYTDAGLSVRVSNIETKIRFVEMCPIQNLTEEFDCIEHLVAPHKMSPKGQMHALEMQWLTVEHCSRRRFLHFKD